MINEQQEFSAYVGLDWGDKRHSVHLQVAGERKAESFELEQKPEALHDGSLGFSSVSADA